MKSGLTGRFVGKVRSDLIDGNMWQLSQTPENTFSMEVDGLGVITPADGFFFDFASIPRVVRAFYPKVGGGRYDECYGEGAVIHDWLYSYPSIDGKPVDRKLADRIFLLGMELKGVRPSLRNLFYTAVRVGGGRYFGNPDRLNKLRGGK